MGKHTEGPWEARKPGTFQIEGEPEACEYPATVVKRDTDTEGRRRTAFVCVCNATTLPNEANATLIATAPDGLALAQMVVEMDEDHNGQYSRYNPRFARLVFVARDLIEKAG